MLLLAKFISVPCKVVLDMSYDYNSQKIYILSLNVIIIVVNLFFSYAYDYLKKKSNEILFYKKIRNVIFITLLCSSYFYITYLTAIIGDKPTKYSLLCDKLTEDSNDMFYRLNKLTYDEYTYFEISVNAPKINKKATNISFEYYYDMFPLNYSYSLEYDLPIKEDIKEKKFDSDQYHLHQWFEIKNNTKHVYYDEGQN